VLQDGSVPTVWLQLLERCVAEPDCHPTALHSLAQQLAEQRAVSALLQQQLLAQQQVSHYLSVQSAQQLAEQRALNAHQQQQIGGLHMMLLSHQQVAAEQGARIAALEGALQQLLQRQPPQ
jgi:hypothetical protein